MSRMPRQWGDLATGAYPDEPQSSLASEDSPSDTVAKVAPDKRRLELDRRAALVIKATRGLEMRERICVAKQLLLVRVSLTPEEWDATFHQWVKRARREVA